MRAVQGLLWYAYWTGKPEVVDLLCAWADSWRDAILAEKQGKPSGVCPPLIHYKTRDFAQDGSPWFEPAVDTKFTYYRHPIGYRRHIYNLLLAAYELSGDEKYLEPFRAALRLLASAPPPPDEDDEEEAQKNMKPGSLEWIYHWKYRGRDIDGKTTVVSSGSKYRLATGDKSFDAVLERDGNNIIRFPLHYEARNNKRRAQRSRFIVPARA